MISLVKKHTEKGIYRIKQAVTAQRALADNRKCNAVKITTCKNRVCDSYSDQFDRDKNRIHCNFYATSAILAREYRGIAASAEH